MPRLLHLLILWKAGTLYFSCWRNLCTLYSFPLTAFPYQPVTTSSQTRSPLYHWHHVRTVFLGSASEWLHMGGGGHARVTQGNDAKVLGRGRLFSCSLCTGTWREHPTGGRGFPFPVFAYLLSFCLMHHQFSVVRGGWQRWSVLNCSLPCYSVESLWSCPQLACVIRN